VQKHKHLIIGCGSAALSALKQIRKLGSEDEVKLVTMEPYSPYSPMSLPYLVSGRRKEPEIYIADDGFFHRMKSTLVTGKRVERIDPDQNKIVYDNGETEGYDTLLIATGSTPILQPVLRQAGVPGFHIMDDYLSLKNLEDKRQITLLGAGFVGMELAVAFSERGHRVSVIAPRERILRSYFDPDLDDIIINLFNDHGIDVNLGWGEVSEIHSNNGRFVVAFSGGHTTETDNLIAATGVEPRMTFLDGSGINLNKGIVVDRMMRTNIDNIFSAGDVAEAPSFLTGKNGLSLIHPSAVEQGKIAGSNMIGEDAIYDGWISMNIFNFLGHLAVSIGDFTPSEGDYVLEKKKATHKKYRKIVFRDDRLVGANFFNIDIDGGAIRYLIKSRIEIGPHKDLLLKKPKETSLWLMSQAEKKATASLER
jgi:phenylglyoxylate dehydrogenase epsilon subunit